MCVDLSCIQCNALDGLTTLKSPARDVDLLTKTLTENDAMVISVKTSTPSNNNDLDVDQFSSFMFWRQPLPSVDLSDLDAVLSSSEGHRPTSEDAANAHNGGGVLVAEDFDEFNYWRVPIAPLDVGDLLRCLNPL